MHTISSVFSTAFSIHFFSKQTLWDTLIAFVVIEIITWVTPLIVVRWDSDFTIKSFIKEWVSILVIGFILIGSITSYLNVNNIAINNQVTPEMAHITLNNNTIKDMCVYKSGQNINSYADSLLQDALQYNIEEQPPTTWQQIKSLIIGTNDDQKQQNVRSIICHIYSKYPDVNIHIHNKGLTQSLENLSTNGITSTYTIDNPTFTPITINVDGSMSGAYTIGLYTQNTVNKNTQTTTPTK